jgi:hypothetical protein
MKIERCRDSSGEEAGQQENTIPKYQAVAGPMHRRTTVTVERETLTVLLRRPIAEPSPHPADAEMPPPLPDK